MDANEFADRFKKMTRLNDSSRMATIAELATQAVDSGICDPRMGKLIVTATGVNVPPAASPDGNG